MKSLRPCALAAAALLTLASCSRAQQPAAAAPAAWPPKPTAEFLALDRKGQNLAVYDAFWQQIDTNYYDAGLFATDEWKSFRAQWRERAAAAPSSFILYHDVFPHLIELLPESHVSAHGPESGSSTDPAPKPVMDEKTSLQLATLMMYGPGFDKQDVMRGHAYVALVGDVRPGSAAADAGIPPGARLLRAHQNFDFKNKAIHFEVDYVPLHAAAARAWERGAGADQAAAPESIRYAKFDAKSYPWRKEIEARKLAGGVLYLRFPGFGEDAYMTPVYAAIDAATPAGLIVDLRWNIGGMGVQLQKFAGALMGEGKFLADTRSRSEAGKMLATAYPKTYTGPLVVLVGPGTGSSAEIFAAAVQDQERGKLIGRLTSGQVLAAIGFALPDAGYVSLPVSNVWRAGGRRLEGIGVEPDLWILPTLDDVRAGRDPVLEQALRELHPSSANTGS